MNKISEAFKNAGKLLWGIAAAVFGFVAILFMIDRNKKPVDNDEQQGEINTDPNVVSKPNEVEVSVTPELPPKPVAEDTIKKERLTKEDLDTLQRLLLKKRRISGGNKPTISMVLLIIMLGSTICRAEEACDYCYSEKEHQAVLNLTQAYEEQITEIDRLSSVVKDLGEWNDSCLDLNQQLRKKEKQLNLIKSNYLESEVINRPSFSFTYGGQVTKDDDLILRQYMEDPETGEVLVDWTTNIDMNAKFKFKPYKESWWDKNKFTLGFVGGVAITVVGGVAIAALVGAL